MPGADGMSAKFMKNAFVGWTFTAGQYYPPDFDPSKLLPLKHLKAKGEQKEKLINIRMMFPFTMICDACGEYNYTGTKFSSKCEMIKNESYLGLKVYRFYGRCKHCWSEFTFKTDPKNSDYTMESGGKRTYEAWKDADMAEAELKKEKEDAEKDQMKALEQKSIDVQAEMQRIEDLDAIRTLNKRNGARDQSIEEALDFLFKKQETEASAEDQLSYGEKKELEGFREAQEEKRRLKLEEDSQSGPSSSHQLGNSSSSSSPPAVEGATTPTPTATTPTTTKREEAIAAAIAERASQSSNRPAVGARFTVKRKAPADEEDKEISKKACVEETAGGSADNTGSSTAVSSGLGLVGTYDSDSSE
mmetsp:Transcript_27085/g.43387  ORF Transcript_27085/g.43387 Transcript_27085/m.43387 type:complete len:360 (+) Transcript_27085:76-1155(+)|eukprot:CAMPEP_0169246328 /NCGR_PEP_ID=MMETSP1016-20121227/34673_1 /TAXON_ID=342587 /ORGANISM="Karlodinium micrum, Strain CCMP2283" /LENGTH=359 /DNA_ID=CAMNT_0009326895 /DNA_START=74 /DNA_END=1153 /DNA_ORIENTATION=-